MLTRTIRIIITFLGGIAIVYEYRRKYKDQYINKLILSVYTIICFHAGIIVLMYLNENLRLLIYEITGAYNIVNLNYPFLHGYRISGLTYGLSQTSVIQMYPLIMVFKVIEIIGKSFKNFVIILASTTLSLISIFLTGRSGLFLFIVLFPVLMILMKKVKAKTLIRSIILSGILFFLLYGIVGILNSMNLSILPSSFISYNLNQAKEAFFLFTNNESQTVEAIKTMYFLPNESMIFLFGSSSIGRSEYLYISSDVGFIKLIFAIGVFGLFLYMLPFIRFIKLAFIARKKDLNYSSLVLVMLLSSLLLNFKELAIYTRSQWSIQSLLIAGSFFIINDSIKQNEKLR
jgi:hypothetical protein